MTHPTPGTQEWLDQVVEDIIEPDLPILDPHHHMWPQGQGLLLFQLLGLFQQMLKGCSEGESSPDFSFSRLFSMC